MSRRRRGNSVALVGIMLFAFVFKTALLRHLLQIENGLNLFRNISGLLMAASIICVFATFNFTESSPEKEWTGFPYRLFVLPLPTLLLVALPLIAGVLAMGLVCGFWLTVIFQRGDVPEPGWLTLLLMSYMVFFQTMLWCLAGFRFGRLVVLGLAGPVYVLIGFLPWQPLWSTVWLSQKRLSLLLCGQMMLLAAVSWYCIARQRCGGGRRTNWFRLVLDWVLDLLPRRRKDFASPAGAQFWFEWRRGGMILPVCVAAMLYFFIYPFSRHSSSSPEDTLRTLFWTLATPFILAAIVGKGLSQPDFWSSDLSCPAFNVVRPISSEDMIVAKLKVAILSTAISWAMILVFLYFWLAGWADLDSLNFLRIGYWMAYHHSVLGQNLIGALIVLACIFATWKCMVDGFWSGLSGSRKRYFALPSAYVLMIGVGFIVLAVLLNHDAATRAWYRANPDRPLSWLVDLAALALIVKFFLAARAWRYIAPPRVRKYVLLWLGTTTCLIGLVLLLWADGLFDLVLCGPFGFLPLDGRRVLSLLLLSALLAMPLARIGLAPSSLSTNRHR